MAILRGTPGDDTIAPGGVTSGVTGGLPSAGNDSVFGSAGHDRIDGVGGLYADAIDYSELPGPVAVAFDAPTQDATVDKGILGSDTLLGTWYLFTLTAGADSFITQGTLLHNAAAVTGGAGNDTIDGGLSRVVELRYGGSPAGVAVDLAAGTAQDGFGGTDSLAGIWALRGSDHADTLLGTDATETFFAGAGNDVIDGRGGFDRLIYDPFGRTGQSGVFLTLTGTGAGTVVKPLGGTDHFAGIEYIEATAGRDTLVGSAGDDSLDGGWGGDILAGGTGNDTYLVDNAADLIFEAPDAGTDAVIASTSFYLYANLEALTLANGASFGVGNTLANTITGNDFANLLIGGDGTDTLIGNAGNDQLFGQAAADSLLGGTGIDYLAGGDGADTLDGGADADNLFGEAGDDSLAAGTGFVTDILTGGDGTDTLYAASGQGDYDLLSGGTGDDTYFVDTPDDLTFEGAGGGTDTVIADIALAGIYLWPEVENLILLGTTPFGVGNALDNRLTGSAATNWLLGGDGADTLDGGAGDDVLFGEAGADTFFFSPGNGHDLVADYTPEDSLVFLGYAEVLIRHIDGTAATVTFRDADGSWREDMVLLHGGFGGPGGLTLGNIDVGDAELSISSDTGITMGGIPIATGFHSRNGGGIHIVTGSLSLTGDSTLPASGSLSLASGNIHATSSSLRLDGGSILTAAAPPEDHTLIA